MQNAVVQPILEARLQQVLARFPALSSLPRSTMVDLVGGAEYLEVPQGTRLFSPTEPCQGFPLILEGVVRVVRESSTGKSITLYTVEAGELCIISGQRLYGTPNVAASGYADTTVIALSISYQTVDALLASEPAFRRFFFGLTQARLADLMLAVDAIAFLRLDQRLAAFLVEKGPVVHLTHQAIADQLGVAREMVSRVMRSFSEQHWVRQAREGVEVIDIAALDHLAASKRAMQ